MKERGTWAVLMLLVFAASTLVWAGLFQVVRSVRVSGCCTHGHVRSELVNIQQALGHFRLETNNDCPQHLNELFEARFLNKPPLDPWGQPFHLVCPGRHDPEGADVVSAGPDRRLGTVDDVASWDETP